MNLVVFDSKGNALVKYPNTTNKEDEDVNFQGVLSIIGPISKIDKTYLFTLTIGKHNVDVSYGFGYYVLAIIDDLTKSELKSCNSLFAYTAGNYFNKFYNEKIQNGEMPANIYESFLQLIPNDPLNSIQESLQSLLSNEIEYISFLTRGNRVLHSVGKPSEEPEQFIFSWSAALNAIDEIGEENYSKVEGYSKVSVFRFSNSINAVCYTRHDSTIQFMTGFLDTLHKLFTNWEGLFHVTEKFVPKQPDKPHSSGRSRKGRMTF